MGRNEKKAYLEVTRQRYKKACKIKKGKILEEFCETCGYNRKYAIRLLNKKAKRRQPKPRKGRPRYNKVKVLVPLTRIFHKLSQFRTMLNFYQCKNIFA